MLVLDQKLNQYISANGLVATEDKCRMMQIVLRHKVHKFPVGIPVVAAVKSLEDGKLAVFNLKRTTLATIDGDAVASETNIGKEFEIDGIRYVQTDTVDGMARYKPFFNKKQKNRGFEVSAEEREKLSSKNL